MSTRAIRVELNPRRGWEIVVPDEREPVLCATLEDARRVAYQCAAQRHQCELVVCDAYHRVLHRQVISNDEDTLVVRREAAGARTRRSGLAGRPPPAQPSQLAAGR